MMVYLTWIYTGGTMQESLFIAMVFLGILLIRPIPFQTKEEREELLDKMEKNREKIKELHRIKREEKSQIEQDSLNRAAKRHQKEEAKKKKGSSKS